MTTTINFYNVGLNATNLPYNAAALANILQAGQIEDGGQVFALTLTALPFDQFFNITNETYQIVKSATYLKLTNTFTDDQNVKHIETRYAFIDKIQQLANGNYSVYYTLDNWTSFYINSGLYTLHIDGFTERANVPLWVKDGATYKFNTNGIPLTGKFTGQQSIKKFKTISAENEDGDGAKYYGKSLPAGFSCVVVMVEQPYFQGTPQDTNGHGKIYDYNNTGNPAAIANNLRYIDRLNSNLYYAIFDDQGKLLPQIYKDYTDGGKYKLINALNLNYTPVEMDKKDIDDSHILKIMYFDYFPASAYDDTLVENVTVYESGAEYGTVYPYAMLCGQKIHDSATQQDYNNTPMLNTDIHYGVIDNHRNKGYFYAHKLENFRPIKRFSLSPTLINIVINGRSVSRQSNYNAYLNNSLYRNIDEARKIKLKFLTAEIETSIDRLICDQTHFPQVFQNYSGDLETITLKLKIFDSVSVDGYKENSNEQAATSENINFFDLVQVRDYKSYKNAKIMGAAGIAATTIGTIVSLIASIATYNVAGVAGSLAGGAAGIIGQAQKMEGLTPVKQSPANGDYTLTEMTFTDLDKLTIEIETFSPSTFKQKIIDLEQNGCGVAMEFNQYLENCQMEAYNAIKMSVCDVTGAPSEICDDIKNKLLLGVTLWTASDVGNKAVINYKKEN